MLMGTAAGLFVLAGLWRSFEWIVHGRNSDSMRLIPGGVIYLILGLLIAFGLGGTIVGWAALVVAIASLVGSFLTRNRSQVRRWVMWALVLIDLAIVSSLIGALSA
ncbi:MAG: hypothetical protein JJ911_01290 [Rhizobiaceae bacterium]|nr:hypothetical protein [Rhizobiaceae bacterium]